MVTQSEYPVYTDLLALITCRIASTKVSWCSAIGLSKGHSRESYNTIVFMVPRGPKATSTTLSSIPFVKPTAETFIRLRYQESLLLLRTQWSIYSMVRKNLVLHTFILFSSLGGSETNLQFIFTDLAVPVACLLLAFSLPSFSMYCLCLL